jgi:hypothetical protein
MDWTEFQRVKASLPDKWMLDEDAQTLVNEEGDILIAMADDRDMFRALVADALSLHHQGAI